MIRIGVEMESDTSEIIRFLHGLFYNHKDEVEEFIDFSENEKLRKDVESMGLAQGIVKGAIEYGRSLEQEKMEQAERKIQELEHHTQELEDHTQKLEYHTQELEQKQKLYQALLKDNRMEELRLVMDEKNTELEQKLMQEYGIEE